MGTSFCPDHGPNRPRPEPVPVDPNMWAEAGADLGVDVIAPYRVDTIDCSAYFPQFGELPRYPHGTVVLVGDLL